MEGARSESAGIAVACSGLILLVNREENQWLEETQPRTAVHVELPTVPFVGGWLLWSLPEDKSS